MSVSDGRAFWTDSYLCEEEKCVCIRVKIQALTGARFHFTVGGVWCVLVLLSFLKVSPIVSTWIIPMEHCFQLRDVSSTLAQFALRSLSWGRAAGLPPTIIDLACSFASPVSPSSLTGLCLDKVLEALLWCWELPVPVPRCFVHPGWDHRAPLKEESSSASPATYLSPPPPPTPSPPSHTLEDSSWCLKAISRLIYYAVTFHGPSYTGVRNVNWWVSLRCSFLGFTLVSKGGEGRLRPSLWWLRVHSHWLLLMLKPMVMIDLNPVIYSILGH